MNKLIIGVAAVLTTFAFAANAADSSCDSKAADKHLNGAAKASFVKKCERTEKASAAKAQCDSQAADKKLHGAAKNSFVKKCVTDASK